MGGKNLDGEMEKVILSTEQKLLYIFIIQIAE
jgi:hypothetical protein